MDSGMRLFQSQLMAIFRYDGRLIHFAAHRNWPAEALAQVQKLYPMPVDENTLAGRVILGGKAIAVEDTQAERHYTPALLAKTGGWRRMIIAPMLKDGHPVGTVHVAWRDPGATPPRQIELLQTFADQAVIAIENVRLLNETQEALERQTATAEVLQVDRRFGGRRAAGARQDPRQLRAPVRCRVERPSCWSARTGCASVASALDVARRRCLRAGRRPTRRSCGRTRAVFPMPLAGTGTAAAIACGPVLNYPDVLNGPDVPASCARRPWRRGINYSQMMAPLMQGTARPRRDHVSRATLGGFTDKEQALLQDLRRPGGDRDRERAAVQRDAGGAGPPDRQRRHPARHQQLAHRRAAGVRGHRRQRPAAVELHARHGAAHRRTNLPAGGGGQGGRLAHELGGSAASGRPRPRLPVPGDREQDRAAPAGLDGDRAAPSRGRGVRAARLPRLLDAAADARRRLHRRARAVACRGRPVQRAGDGAGPSPSATTR